MIIPKWNPLGLPEKLFAVIDPAGHVAVVAAVEKCGFAKDGDRYLSPSGVAHVAYYLAQELVLARRGVQRPTVSADPEQRRAVAAQLLTGNPGTVPFGSTAVDDAVRGADRLLKRLAE